MPVRNPAKKDMMWRIYLLYVLIGLFGLIIIGKVVHIQLIEGETLREKVKNLTTGYKKIEAVRGNIYADDGSLLATSIPIYEIRMDVNTNALTDDIFYANIDSLALCLSQLFEDRSKNEYKKDLIQARKKGARYHLIQRKVKYTELKALKKFPIFRLGKYKGGLIYEQKNKRKKPFRLLAERTIGYEREGIHPVGLEGAYSEYLSGVQGKRLMKKISGGVWMPIGDNNEIEPKDGSDIYTTIDINTQDVAEHALLKQLSLQQADHGTVVLMEVQTGEIKAIANLKRTEDGRYYEGYNYAIGEATEPGSTFKLGTLIALLEDGYADLDDLIDTEGGKKRYYDRMMFDTHDYGTISLKESFELSSNIAFAKATTASYSSNPQQFIDRLKKMGLNRKLGIEIAGEGEPWIKDTDDKTWSGITLPWMAHGYEVLLTPLQILTFYNAVANNGKMVKPKFVKKIMDRGRVIKTIPTEVLIDQICSEETIEKVKSALEGVVENGTAKNLKAANYKIAGKTGTAQIANDKYGYKYESKVSHQASFVGYFPADNPKYSCIVVVNAPSRYVYTGNLVAGPIFKEVADKIYAKRLEIHEALAEQDHKANSAIPYSKSGYFSDLNTVFESLSIETEVTTQNPELVSTVTTDSTVLIRPRKTNTQLVPNVVGMGLQDALYLLENRGLKVVFSGKGVIKRQSIPNGTKLIPGSTINLELST
jgi:cell division protein FtsI (penicillin-binding protein 3)